MIARLEGDTLIIDSSKKHGIAGPVEMPLGGILADYIRHLEMNEQRLVRRHKNAVTRIGELQKIENQHNKLLEKTSIMRAILEDIIEDGDFVWHNGEDLKKRIEEVLKTL